MRSLLLSLLVAALAAILPPVAAATPVATSGAQYTAQGRVFPDPLAQCPDGAPGCSPYAKGNVNATQFVQLQEFIDAMKFMNQQAGENGARNWARYMEVLPLDGKEGTGSGTTPGDAMFPGNNLPDLEFTPDPKFVSAGLASTDGSKVKSDLHVVRVTDETVPDAGKKRYAISLSIHGIERAGVEGGLRAIEDLVTAAENAEGASHLDDPILPAGVEGGPTFAQALRESIIYFSFPNPDGWRRGSFSQALTGAGGVFFQRYNGNGVDVNRDWPGVGYSYRPYSGLSEPESRALSSYFQQVEGATGDEFVAGDDLHGQPEADALSYTLIPNSSKSFDKDLRIRETSKLINKVSYEALKWSPIIQPNDRPAGGGTPCIPGALGDVCAKIHAQTWGTVYDTINYTTTGALGDWFDSPIGLGADGIDNEMSFSHLDKNIVFEPQTEQMHVDGNKFLIFAHLASILDPATGSFQARGRKGYVPNTRIQRGEKDNTPPIPANTEPQPNFTASAPAPTGSAAIPFEVESTDPTPAAKGIYNGGMRVDVRVTNFQGTATGTATLRVQCRGCDDHPGVEPDQDGWVTVQEDYNQSLIYLQAGVTAAVNRPQAINRAGDAVEWQALVEGAPPGTVNLEVEFSSGPATTDGDTAGALPPKQAAYDVANTDFLEALNASIPEADRRLDEVDPRKVISGAQSLSSLDTLVLADDPLPGYLGPLSGGPQAPTGPPTADQEYDGGAGTVPGGGSGVPGTSDDHEFTVGPNDANASMKVRIEWADGTNDWDLTVLRKTAGGEQKVGSSAGGPPATSEEVVVPNPPAGDYIVRATNYAAPSPSYHGTISFEALPAGSTQTATGAYTVAEKDAWFAKLAEFVRGGGNLVLTDGALRGLSELTGIEGSKIGLQTVYAGQMSFGKAADQPTTDDPLARDVAQPGARFNSGMRRQTYEPVPIGFAIQNAAGSDGSFARQFDVDRAAFEAAGGRYVAGSADAGARNAQAVYTRVTLGELPMGKGQIRIAGALLPQPTQEFDHPFGLSPHGVTYTGYILARNLLDAERAGAGAASSEDGGAGRATGAAPASGARSGTPAQTCQSGAGFRSVTVRPRSARLGLSFNRRVGAPVQIDVFQQSIGRRIIGERLVARFLGRQRGLTWNGTANRPGRTVADGYYLVRYRIRQADGASDYRRVALRRVHGRFSLRGSSYRRASCDLLRSFKLERPVFGGRTNRALGIAYQLNRSGRVRVEILRDGGLVRRYADGNRTARQTFRLRLASEGLRPGDYRVRITVTRPGAKAVTSTLVARRL